MNAGKNWSSSYQDKRFVENLKYIFGILLFLSLTVMVLLYLYGGINLKTGKIVVVLCSAFAATSIIKLLSLKKWDKMPGTIRIQFL